MAPRGDRTKGAPARQVAFRLGLTAENRAAAVLVAKGYRIISRRWRSAAGEIDIVARRGNVLVFIEVKARAAFDAAAYAVTARQQRRIAAAAAAWLAVNTDDAGCDIRFDVILVAPRRWPRHIEAAFDAGG
ncbi:MAG: YraN family protein [Pseudorhodoplanes sp.]|nr:YraN family protein [Pseudorhodoplanes sp.]